MTYSACPCSYKFHTIFYIESNYKFEFDNRWHILKYDDHPYYRIVSGRSFSGIDFADHLYLIEVKNFYQYDNDGEIVDLKEFVLEMKEKILDSIDLIDIIRKYHQRKWSYRLFMKLVNRFPGLNQDWWFWTRMHALVDTGSMSFVLLIETKENIATIRSAIISSLEEENYIIPNVIVQSLTEKNLKGVEIVSDDISRNQFK